MMSSACKVVLFVAGVVGTGAVKVTPENSVKCISYADAPQAFISTPNLVAPQDIAIDGAGDVFVVDAKLRQLIRIDQASGQASVLLDQTLLQYPVGLTISPLHADLYIGDENNSMLYHLGCQTKNQNYCAQYNKFANPINMSTSVHPVGLQLDGNDHLFIADFKGHRVLRRDTTTGIVSTLISHDILAAAGKAPTEEFGPHDISIDPVNFNLYVTDITNDDIWIVKCKANGIDKTGNSCDVYDETSPVALQLDSGTATGIESPSGIAHNQFQTIFVSGQADGIVAEITGSQSNDLLTSSSTKVLKMPVSLAFDARPTAKTIFISDDMGSDSEPAGLYSLSCKSYICVPLSAAYVKGVAASQCTNTPVGVACDFECASGYASPNGTSIACTSQGWAPNFACLSTGPSASGTTVGPATGDDGVGVAVGVTLAVLIVAAVGVFLFIRYRQGKLTVRTGDYAPFSSGGV